MKHRTLFVFLCLTAFARAQSIDVNAGFASTHGIVGETLQFEVRVTATVGRGGSEPQVKLPEVKETNGLDVRYQGGGFSEKSSSIRIIGGRRTSSTTYVGRFYWDVVASKVGRYPFPTMAIEVNGKTYRTQTITLTIVKDAPGNRYVGTVVVVSTTKPYVNQPVRLRYVLTSERNIVRDRRGVPRLTIPWAGSPNGFKSLPLVKPSARQSTLPVILNGGDQAIPVPAALREDRSPPVIELTLDKVLYPLAAGKINLGGTQANLEVAREQRDGGFFRGTEYIDKTRAIVKTEPVILDVRDAPLANRPKGYRGAIGDFSGEVKYGKGEIRAGDGVTLNLILRGGEVLTLIEEPKIDGDFPNCRVLPSGRRMKGQGNSRTLTFSWLIKPLKDDLTELPRFDYGWFKPASEKFEVISTGPLPLTITGKMAEESVFSGGERKKSDQIKIDLLGEGVSPLRDDPGEILETKRPSLIGFWLALFLPLGSLGVLNVFLSKKRKLAGDATIGRRKGASKAATSRLSEAQSLLGGKGFYGKLARSLGGFVADKLGLPPASVSAATAESILSPRGLKPERIKEVTTLLNELDMREFGADVGDESEQREALGIVQQLIESLDKEIR